PRRPARGYRGAGGVPVLGPGVLHHRRDLRRGRRQPRGHLTRRKGSMTEPYLERIAAHLGGITHETAPAEVRERVGTALLYNLSMALGGHGANAHLDALCQIVHAEPGRG